MIDVIPLKYGTVFKRVFSNPEVFTRFAQDILGITLNIDQVHTEYEYPEPIGFIRSRYDLFAEDEEQRIIVEIQHVKEEDFFDRFLYLISMAEQVRGYDAYGFERTVFTIVVLTGIPRNGSVDFSYAVSDFSSVDERGNKIAVYPHRLVFLSPPQAGEHTPLAMRTWLDFIADSLDGKMNESSCNDALFRQMAEEMRRHTTDPAVLAEIKDEAAWDKAVQRFLSEGMAHGIELGRQEGRAEGVLAQQRKTVLEAHRMGMNPTDIAALTGITPTEVEKIIAGAM